MLARVLPQADVAHALCWQASVKRFCIFSVELSRGYEPQQAYAAVLSHNRHMQQLHDFDGVTVKQRSTATLGRLNEDSPVASSRHVCALSAFALLLRDATDDGGKTQSLWHPQHKRSGVLDLKKRGFGLPWMGVQPVSAKVLLIVRSQVAF